MRDILFRGKRLDNGEWEEGFYCKHDRVKCCFSEDDPETKHLIIKDGFCDWGFEPPLQGVEVNPSTVGQYTGLLDKHGKRIFEGDIVKYTFDNPDSPNATENGKKVRIGRVFFSDWRASFSVTAGRNCSSALNNDLFNYVRNGNRVEVVGNVHETADLLEDDIDE